MDAGTSGTPRSYAKVVVSAVSIEVLAGRVAATFPEAAAMEREALAKLIEELVADAMRLEIHGLEDVERLVGIRFWFDPAKGSADLPFVMQAILSNLSVPARSRLEFLEKHVRPRMKSTWKGAPGS